MTPSCPTRRSSDLGSLENGGSWRNRGAPRSDAESAKAVVILAVVGRMHVEVSGHVVPREKLAALTGAPLAQANKLELERSRDPALLGRLQRDTPGGTGDDRAITGSRPLPGFFEPRLAHDRTSVG